MVQASLSPSRAGDFMQCPLLYRFRVIDRLVEPPNAAAVRGTVVHAVLESLFDLPAAERTVATAVESAPGHWGRILAEQPRFRELFEAGSVAEGQWLDGVAQLVRRWFTLEDPRQLEPAERELFVSTSLSDGLVLRGYVDRLDVLPDGSLQVVDYKTGRSPAPGYEQKAWFQMKFYALVLWRLRSVVPAQLRLVYLGDGKVLTYEPKERDLITLERKVLAIWRAIDRATTSGDWRPSTGKLCDWCAHKAICPAWGGVPPALAPAQGG